MTGETARPYADGLLELVDDAARPRRVDVQAGAHRRGQRDALDVAALRRGGLGPDDLVDERGVVLDERALVEALLADRDVDVGAAVGAVLELAGLRVRDGLGDVERDRAGLRVRHQAARPEHAAELADVAHLVGRRDRDVEVEEAALDLRGEVGRADDVGPGLLGLAGLVALGEHRDAHRRGPVPCGSISVPRSCSSAWRTLRPSRKCTSTVSSNLAPSMSLRILIASTGE